MILAQFDINVGLLLTLDSTTAIGRNPLQKPTLPGPVTSYGIHGLLKSALATE